RLERWRDRWRRRGAKRRGARTGGDGRAGAGVRAWPAACRPGAGGLTVPLWPEFLGYPPSLRVACEVAGGPPRSWWDATAPDFPGLSRRPPAGLPPEPGGAVPGVATGAGSRRRRVPGVGRRGTRRHAQRTVSDT